MQENAYFKVSDHDYKGAGVSEGLRQTHKDAGLLAPFVNNKIPKLIKYNQ